MDWLIGILLLVTGAIIGYFVAKYVSNKEIVDKSSGENEHTIKELMIQQASQHLHETKLIAEQLAAKSESLKQQIENYEQLIINQSAGDEASSLNYFGEHASTYLRNKNLPPKRDNSNADIQPLDFSAQGSGLFSGDEELSEKETK